MSYGCSAFGFCRNSTDYIPPDMAGSITPSITQGSSRGGVAFSPVVISLIVILGFAFILISYYTVFSKYCMSLGSRIREGRGRGSDDGLLVNEISVPMINQGLEDSIVKSIPVFKYNKVDGLVEGTECAVCLSEFEENVSLRLLPKCSHAFHISCIDKWLQSHSNCPLCRANIVSTTQPISIAVQISNEHRGVDGNSSGSPLPEVPQLPGHVTTHEEAPRDTTVEGFLHIPRAGSDSEQQVEAERDHPQCGERGPELFTHEEKLRLKAPDKFPNQFGVLHLAHMRSVSMNLDFNNGSFDRKHAHFSGRMPGFRRSHSTGSFSVNTRMEFSVYLDLEQNTVSGWRSHEGSNRMEQTTTNIKEFTCAVSADPSSADSCRVVDILRFGSLDNRGRNQDLKSKSFSYAMNLRDNTKADAVNPSRGRMASLKCPLGLKRSLSGGRIFGFMTAGKARSTSGDETRSVLRSAP